VQVVDEGENSSVLNHEFDKGHELSGKILLKVHVENLGEGGHDNFDLLIVQDLQGLLILEFKMSFISQQ